jgi:hypothetical protein
MILVQFAAISDRRFPRAKNNQRFQPWDAIFFGKTGGSWDRKVDYFSGSWAQFLPVMRMA